MIFPFFNFRDAQYKIADTSLLKVPATEHINSQLDNVITRHPANSPAGEIRWQGEQQIDEEACNENTQHCGNCRLLQSEYGRVLFERDLAQRNLRLASYRLEDDLQRQRNRKNNGMDLTLFSLLSIIYAQCCIFDHLFRVRMSSVFGRLFGLRSFL